MSEEKEFNEEISKHPDKRIQKIFSMRYSGNKKLTPWRKIAKVQCYKTSFKRS